MSSINVIGSQIDVASVVSQLMKIERQPVYLLEDRVASMRSKVTAYQTLNTGLSALANSVNKLLFGSSSAPLIPLSSFKDRLEKSVFTSRTATSSNENLLTATASGAIASGSYNIAINKLALAQTSVSGYVDINANMSPFTGQINLSSGKAVNFELKAPQKKSVATGLFESGVDDPIGWAAGKLKITGSNGSAEIDVDGSSTLASLVEDINLANVGVTASIVSDGGKNRLEITANGAGTANAFTLSFNMDNPDDPAVKLEFEQTKAATDSSIRELQKAINSAVDEDGKSYVTASIINDGVGYKLMITSKETGATNAFTLDGPGFEELQFVKTVLAQDAEFTMNGIDIISKSNTVKGAIEGVTLNLKNVSKDGEFVKLDVGVDNDSIVSAVRDIVSAYNSVSSYINYQFTYNTSKESAGVLSGDSTLRSIQSRLQSAITTSGMPDRDSAFYDASDYRSISQLGISFNKDGSLSLDEGKLKEALANDIDKVASFFLGYEKEGYQDQFGGLKRIGGMLSNLGDALKGLTDPLRNPIKSALDGLNSNIRSMEDSIAAYERRLESREDMLYAQFSAADEALRMMQVTMSSLNNALASLLNTNNSNKK